MNKKLHFIFARRTIRAYEAKPVSDGTVKDLLEAGMAAPSSGGKSPWRFVVVRNKETLARLAVGLPNGSTLQGAPLCIVVCGDTRVGETHSSHIIQDCSAAVENILLAATALGLGSCWLGVHPEESIIANYRSVLGIPSEVIPLAAVSIGWPEEQREPRTQYTDAFVRHEHW